MKVTMFTSQLIGGGAERVICNLANHFDQTGWDVEIVTLDESPACEPLHDRVKHTFLLPSSQRSNKLMNLLRKFNRLRKYVHKHRTDAYVVMLPIPITLILQFATRSIAPMICSERADPTVHNSLQQFLLRKLCRRAGAWVFQTETVREWYLPYLGDTPSVVIPNAINPAFLIDPYVSEHEKTIVSAGRLAPQKNFSLLVRAFARIAPDFPGHRLVIYGEGSQRAALEALAAELGVADRVDLPGRVEDMPQRLQRAGMYVLSSDYEGMPNVLIEAMSQGLPCVATDCGGGGARFLVQDGENGLLIPIQDEDAMAQAIRRVLSDEELAQTLGRNALKVRQTLAPEAIYDRWVDIVTSAVAARTPQYKA